MSSSVVGYWVGDSLGRVLGPLQLQAFRDLIASGRLKTAVRASRDGTNWVALQELPEVRDLFTTAAPTSSLEGQQAERLRNQLRGLLHLPPHEVFGLKPQASLDEFRLAFFRMAKRFSPEHLSPDLHPELRKVSVEIFDFLSRRIREAETLFLQGAMHPPAPPPPRLDLGGALPPAPLPLSGTAVPARPPPQAAAIPPTPVPGSMTRPVAASIPPTPAPGSMTRPVAASIPPTPVPGSMTRPVAASIPPTPAPGSMTRPGVPPAPPRPPPVMTPTTRPVTPPPPAPAPAPPPPAPVRRPMAAPAPSYSSAEFVGLERRSDDRLHADVKVSMKNTGIFTDHRIINLSSGGLFIGTDRPLRLGTQVELTLRFDDPERVMTLRSSVIWENSLDDGKNPKGYGLRLSSLRAEERDFIQQYVRRTKKP
ncbi:DnaJ domain-containing protein [Corallococcus coralloides]|uniref:DnaJ domain-containing protein n=1 Tax=Corallococcus coralloides TaxID=184914 RepID=A0A410S190_CORCK|nr:TIGR02266 family protein [Corallococcus coralloides]QAT87781.1 DnaJ domain-containing protein [Corallococcus coralloides]